VIINITALKLLSADGIYSSYFSAISKAFALGIAIQYSLCMIEDIAESLLSI